MTDEDVSVYIILYSRLLSKETTGKCPVCGDRTGCLRTAAMFKATKAGFFNYNQVVFVPQQKHRIVTT